MRVYVCGTRGSTPAPGPEFVRYGGHTSCLALAPGADGDGTDDRPTLLLDAGTGIRRVSAVLGERPFEGTIMLTHLHWDHVQGIPFFRNGDHEGARVTLLMPPQDDGAAAEDVLARMMSPPLFPIRPGELRGHWTFDLLPPAVFGESGLAVEDFTVTAREVPHKGGRTVGYRVTDGHATIAYLPDHCPTVVGPGPDSWGDYHPAALELARDVDVLFHDSQLVSEELAAQASFGHAAADYAVELGRRAGARKVVLFHHRPDRIDHDIDEIVRRFSSAPIEVVGAAEETVLTL
ncbi:MAG TPA: MBL fold metallo-hydrolase [Acidimicrobiales bacterium]